MTKDDVVAKLRALADYLEDVSFNKDEVTNADFGHLLEMLEDVKSFSYYLATL